VIGLKVEKNTELLDAEDAKGYAEDAKEDEEKTKMDATT
jgi:hypothetical protein